MSWFTGAITFFPGPFAGKTPKPNPPPNRKNKKPSMDVRFLYPLKRMIYFFLAFIRCSGEKRDTYCKSGLGEMGWGNKLVFSSIEYDGTWKMINKAP